MNSHLSKPLTSLSHLKSITDAKMSDGVLSWGGPKGNYSSGINYGDDDKSPVKQDEEDGGLSFFAFAKSRLSVRLNRVKRCQGWRGFKNAVIP